MSIAGVDGRSPPVLPEIHGGMACHTMGVYVINLVAKRADIPSGTPQRALFWLADQPEQPCAEDSAEEYVLLLITLAQLPPLLTLIDEWALPLDYKPIEGHAVLEGVHPAVILPALALSEDLDRDEVLITWDGGWGVEQPQVVGAMWDHGEIASEHADSPRRAPYGVLFLAADD